MVNRGSSRGGHLLVGVQHAAGIDEGGTGIDRCRDAERFGDLFAGGAVTRRRFGMHGDTAVAPDGDGDCERDQLPDLWPEQIGLLARGAQRLVALDRVGAEFGNFADPDGELLAIGVPIQHGHITSPDFARPVALVHYNDRITLVLEDRPNSAWGTLGAPITFTADTNRPY